MAKTFLADRQRQWLADLAEHGEQSAVYNNGGIMDELLTVTEALKHPVAAYYLLKYLKKKNKNASAYFDVGDIITVPHAEYGDIPHVVIGKDMDGTGTITLLAKEIICQKCFDAKEASNTDSNRKTYGNNRYSLSNLLQYLNSGNTAGHWYNAKHDADAAPDTANIWNGCDTHYTDEPGYLDGFDIDFAYMLKTVTKRTALNTVTDGGGYEDVESKVFLLSETEVGLGNENNVAEGTQYPYFTNNASRIAYPSDYLKAKANAIGYTTDHIMNSNGWNGWWWWLRTPNSAHSYIVRYVYTGGTLDISYAFGGSFGVRPAIVI